MSLRIREVLKEHNISAIELSELMEQKGTPLSRVSISNILSGKQSPKVETVEDIAKALDIPVTYLFEIDPKFKMETIYRKDENGGYSALGFIRIIDRK